MSKLSPLVRDAYESNARCLDHMGMHGAASRYWKALEANKRITPSWPPAHPSSYATDAGKDARRKIAELLAGKPMTIPELGKVLGLTTSGIAHHTTLMRRTGKIRQVSMTRERHPVWGLA